jgi:pilus assembly protein CpaC
VVGRVSRTSVSREPRLLGRSRLALVAAVLVAGGLLGGLGVTPAGAADARLVAIGENRVGAVRITQGKSETLRTSRSFVDLVVGDPEIADVMPLTDETLYVLGKKIGTTNVSVYDSSKQLVGIIEVEVGYNTPRLAADMVGSGPTAAARVGSANGRTVLSGKMPDAVALADAVAIAKQYGPDVVNQLKVGGSQQVMLEVRFVEASRTAGKDLGINWQVAGKNLNAVVGKAALAGGGTPFGALLGTILGNGVQADVLVQALEEKGLVRRLAEPNLIAISGEKASFLAGGEFPVPVAADDRGRIMVEYKKFGVSLNFLPIVLANGVIHLRIEPEVSQLDPTNTVSTGPIAIPALIVRRASTVVELRDGQSFAIAGLLQSINQQTQEQLPWIADVPILGALFRSASFERKETDLAIIVTPRLVKPARPGERLRTPADSSLPANELELFLTGQQEVPAATAGGRQPILVGHILDLPKARKDTNHVIARN